MVPICLYCPQQYYYHKSKEAVYCERTKLCVVEDKIPLFGNLESTAAIKQIKKVCLTSFVINLADCSTVH